MKKLCCIFMILTLLISVCLPISTYADYELPVYMRIGLLYGSSAPKTLTLSSSHGFNIGTYNERDFKSEQEITSTTVTVTNKDGKLNVTDAAGKIVCSGKSNVGIRPNASGMEQTIDVNAVLYRGAVDCMAADNAITVVNVVFLDHYLYGVVSREMSPSWHIEALKAQAVCSRNYAINNLNKHSDQGFDLCSNVHCQAYSGMKVESENSYAPVDQTTRQVMTYDGELAKLYYCASMGPTTENVEYVWGNTLQYLISVDNSYEDTENTPNGIWNGTLTCDEATAIMRNKGYDVGDVTSIEVLEYTPNNRVFKMKVTGTNGSKTFEREACRTIFNTVTKSQSFTVSGDGDGGESIPNIQTTDGSDIKEKNIKQIVMLTSAGRFNLEGNTLFVTNGVKQQTYQVTTSETKKNTCFYFSGTGWGHSVGMSQYGAKGMAEAGFNYSRILRHYFPGTNLENAY